MVFLLEESVRIFAAAAAVFIDQHDDGKRPVNVNVIYGDPGDWRSIFGPKP